MERAQAELLRARRTAVTSAAQAVKAGIEDRLPASRKLSGVGKNGARIGARYDLVGDTEAIVKAVGPLQLLENDTRPHMIEPKSKGRGANRKKRAGAVRLADGSFRGSVPHPGTKGQHPFAKGADAARPKALKAMADPITDAVKRGIRG